MTKLPESLALNAFVDGELGLGQQLDIEARLRDDAVLRAQVEDLQAQRTAVREGAAYHTAPAALQAALRGLTAAPPTLNPAPAPAPVSAMAPPVPAPLPRAERDRTAAVRRWFAWRPLLVSLAGVALLAVALNLLLVRSGREAQLAEEVLASHVRATLSQRLVDVASSDHHTVKPWLSARLDFSPPVRELSLPGSSFVGGRVDYLGGRPVAALVYRQGQHLVDVFVWPGTSADSRVDFSTQRGFRLAHWSRRGMVHWVVSDLAPDEFALLVRELAADAGP